MTLALSPWLAWLLVAAASAIAVGVFLIRPRPRREVVASVAVWQRVVDKVREQSLWSRIRWACSLVLTAVIAAAIAAAIIRPTRESRTGVQDRALLVLDSSWSMRGRAAAGPTRWARAVEEAHAAADTSPATEIALATTSGGIVVGPTADRAPIHRALDRLEPDGGADIEWPSVADATAADFFTDGARPRALPKDIRVHSVFTPADNVALTAFDVEPAGNAAEIFVAVANFGRSACNVQLTVTRGDTAALARSVSIPAGGSHRETWAVATAGDPRFRAHITTAAGNALDTDDEAVAWLWAAEPLRVGVVGRSSLVPALLSRDPTIRVTVVAPDRYKPTDADVWVFDRWVPDAAPGGPALLIDPPESAWFGGRGRAEASPTWRGSSTTHPVLAGVDTVMGGLGAARAVLRPSLQPIATSDRSTPLVSVEESAAGRYVVVQFAVGEARFAATPAFPILVGNAIDWLGRPERDMRRQPGPASLPAGTRRVVAPNGRPLPLVTAGDGVSTVLPAPGLYLAETRSGREVLSVGLGDPDRSNLLVSTIKEARADRAAPRRGRRPWWVVLTGAALLLAALEWITWRRRVTV